MAHLTFDQWADRYSPTLDGSGGLEQYQTWTSVPSGTDPHHVWAVIEGDDECEHEEECECEPPAWVIMPGYHLVNVMYFTVTEHPWGDDVVEYVLWD
jgi:hypothetical protein